MHRVFRSFLSRMKEDYDKQEKVLDSRGKDLEDLMFEVVDLVDQAEKVLKLDSVASFSLSTQLLEKISTIRAKIPTELPEPVKLHCVNEISPPYETTEFSIPNFQQLVEEKRNVTSSENRFILSETMKLLGMKWRVKIYPNGNCGGVNTHIAVFLELLKGEGLPANFEYKIEIKKYGVASQEISRTYVSKFEKLDSWGWNKMAPLPTILDHGFIRPDGSIIMIVSIRPETYCVAVQQKVIELNKLKKKYKLMKQQRNE